MADINSSSTKAIAKKWGIDTANFFHLSLGEIRAVLIVLISNIAEFTKEDGRAKDEALVLATQHVYHSIWALESLSYELDEHDAAGFGDLSLVLMWARALIEIVDGMFHAESWKITLSDSTLINHFAAVRRRIDQAMEEVSAIHARRFQNAA